MGLLKKILNAGEGKKLKLLQSIVPEVSAYEPELERISDGELAARTILFRERLGNGEDLDDLLPEAFAVVREAGRRVLGQRHYDVQIMGGAGLHLVGRAADQGHARSDVLRDRAAVLRQRGRGVWQGGVAEGARSERLSV